MSKSATLRRTSANGATAKEPKNWSFDPAVLPKSVDSFSKLDWVLVGMLLAGGAQQFVDPEDIAVLCYDLYRPAFRWKKYDFPDLESVQQGYREFRRRYGRRLVVAPTSKSRERRLTGEGLTRAVALTELYVGRSYPELPKLVVAAQRKLKTIKRDATDRVLDQLPTSTQGGGREARTTLAFLTNHPAYRAWKRGQLELLERWQLADVLQCLPDSPPDVFRERLARYEGLAAWWNRSQAQAFLVALRARIFALFPDV